MSEREWHVEMLWVCASCAEKNPGRHTGCQRCGKPKTGREEYAMPGDTSQAAAVADPELLRMATAGANWRCRFCGSDQRRFDGNCAHCGADQAQGHDLGAGPGADPQASAQTPARQAGPRLDPRARLPLLIAAGTLFFCLLAGVCLAFLARRPPATPATPAIAAAQAVEPPAAREFSARLAAVEWEHTVSVERYQIAQGEGFDRPADALEVKKSGQRVHHTDRVQDGTTTESYTETVPDGFSTESYTERQACGETCTSSPQTCTNQCTSQKNGFAKCKQVCTGGGRNCTTKYCEVRKTRQVPRTRLVTRTRQVPRYKEVPRMQDWYIWKHWTWSPQRKVKASGATAETRWPADAEVALNKALGKGEQERAARSGVYRLTFAADDGAEYSILARDLDDFQRRAAAPSARLRVSQGNAQLIDLAPGLVGAPGKVLAWLPMSPLPRLSSIALALLLAGCGAAQAPAKSADPSGASAPKVEESSNKKAEDVPVGAAPATGAAPGMAGGGGPAAKESAKGEARGTSPTNDAGPDDPSANPPSKRLEDVKTEKATGSNGSYAMAVKSAVGMNPDEVGKAINGAAAKTDACYAKLLKKKPAAKTATAFEVNLDGKAAAIKASADTVKDAEWSKCLEAALKTVAWPSPTASPAKGKTVIEFLLQ